MRILNLHDFDHLGWNLNAFENEINYNFDINGTGFTDKDEAGARTDYEDRECSCWIDLVKPPVYEYDEDGEFVAELEEAEAVITNLELKNSAGIAGVIV